jgi:hypothetical protein
VFSGLEYWRGSCFAPSFRKSISKVKWADVHTEPAQDSRMSGACHLILFHRPLTKCFICKAQIFGTFRVLGKEKREAARLYGGFFKKTFAGRFKFKKKKKHCPTGLGDCFFLKKNCWQVVGRKSPPFCRELGVLGIKPGYTPSLTSRFARKPYLKLK